MLVLTILVWHHGAVCFHETGGSWDASGPLDLVGLFLYGVTERCHPFLPDHLGVGLCRVRVCVDNQRDHARLRGRHG